MDNFKKQLALNQGLAFSQALEEMRQETVNATTEVDDYIITIAFENAEGMYMLHNNDLTWEIPAPEENLHVEVVVQDKQDQRFIPGLEIYCSLFNTAGKLIGEKRQPFIWHTFLWHYGINWTIPKEGDYIAQVKILQPKFCRHDEEVGNRKFEQIPPGRPRLARFDEFG